MMNELVLASATRLIAMVRSGEISVLELANAHIEQINLLNPRLHAFADFDADHVREQARRLDQMPEPRGPLYGLPVTVKSSIAVAGYRCEIGSLLHKGSIPEEDACVVARLRAAGALILGTTNCPEFLMAYETVNRLHGRVHNPWDLDRTPGGSSGGESAAIAAGMSAGGLGSDSGGSVRVPAHFTGICSLKPTPGRIPGRGHLPPCVGPFATLGAIGPMARTAEDLDLFFQVLSGQDPIDPISPPIHYRRRTLAELRLQRIGYFEDDGIIPVTPETRAAVNQAADALRACGMEVVPFRPRTLEAMRELWWKFFVQCGAMFYEPSIRGREEELSSIFREFLGIAESQIPLTATTLLAAWAEIDQVRGKMLEEMKEYPVILCPAAPTPAIRHQERNWRIDGVSVAYLDAFRYTQWWNLLGAPAAVVPVSSSREGLPIGVQLAARPFEDESVLGFAQLLDAAFGYRPPQISRN